MTILGLGVGVRSTTYNYYQGLRGHSQKIRAQTKNYRVHSNRRIGGRTVHSLYSNFRAEHHNDRSSRRSSHAGTLSFLQVCKVKQSMLTCTL